MGVIVKLKEFIKQKKSIKREDVEFYVAASVATQQNWELDVVDLDTIVPDKHKAVSFVALAIDKTIKNIHLKDRNYSVDELTKVISEGI